MEGPADPDRLFHDSSESLFKKVKATLYIQEKVWHGRDQILDYDLGGKGRGAGAGLPAGGPQLNNLNRQREYV